MTLCDPMDCTLPVSSVHGIFQASIQEWVAISFPGNLPDPEVKPVSLAYPLLAGDFFTTAPPRKPYSRQKGCSNEKKRQKSLPSWSLHLVSSDNPKIK